MKIKRNPITVAGTVLSLLVLLQTKAAAAGLTESNIYTGLSNLLQDLTTVLTVLSPIVGGAAAIYCLVRRSMADEQDGKMWTKRLTTAIICGVSGMLVSGIIALLSGYFV